MSEDLKPRKLTEANVRNLSPSTGRGYVVRDTEFKGFIVIVNKKSSTWAVQRDLWQGARGRRRLVRSVRRTIGRVGTMPLRVAREEALEVRLLAGRYVDPPFIMETRKDGGPPNYASARNGVPYYEFPSTRVATHFVTDMPLRVSAHRGLGAYANVFAIESFIDELAHEAGADPVECRFRFLKNERARDVLTKAAEAFGWDAWEGGRNRGRGIAFSRYKNLQAYTAVAVEVQVVPRIGRIRLVHAVASNDSGHMVAPDNVGNQIEGGLIQSTSWTLKEEVKFDDTSILSMDWASYPILTFNEVPPVEMALIDRPGEPYLGTGETSQCPTGAAIANAVFDAVGARVTQLPLTPDRVKAAMDA